MTAVEATPIHELGVNGIAAGVARGELSPVEVAKAFLARIDRIDGQLKSFSYLDRETVLIEATRLEEEAKAGKLRGPLHGVPVAVKEQFAVGGVPTLEYWADDSPPVAAEDSTAVARMREAGALLLGKLYMVSPKSTPPTRNPWNLDHTPGGSSSGSGAAVGARLVPVAMSEQTGGSGLRPAAYCGVGAFKPTYGRNSRHGMFAMSWSLDHACIIGLTMEDIARVFSVIGGPDPKDPTTLPDPVAPMAFDALRPPRVGVVRNFFPERATDAINEAIERAANSLAGAGATVTDALLPDDFGTIWPANLFLMSAEGGVINAKKDAGASPAKRVVNASDRFANIPRKLMEPVPATYYLQVQRFRRSMRDRVAAMFADYDMLLMPLTPEPAPKGIETSGDPSLLMPWTFLGNPAITLNAGLSPDGLPIGLQFVGAPVADEKLLQDGAWCERVLGTLGLPAIADF